MVAVTSAHINHISIGAKDLDESVRFYVEVFGAEVIDTPNFGLPVQWLSIGALQLHISVRQTDPPTYNHFAMVVDDFESVYRTTRDWGGHDGETMGYLLGELPSGQVQLYIRDPAGNLVEVNAYDARTLSQEIQRELFRLEDHQPQDASNRKAALFLPGGSRDRR